MGSLFRSEEMTLCQFFLQAESAYTCVSELGELGLVQFRDLNPEVNAFQRKFTNEVRRCDEMERKLRFLQKEIQKDGIPMLDTGDNPSAPLPREMIDLESTLEKLEVELKEVNTNAEALKKNYLELTELKQILRKTHAFFDESHNLQQPMKSTKTFDYYTDYNENDDDDPDVLIVDENTQLLSNNGTNRHFSYKSHSIWQRAWHYLINPQHNPIASFEMQMNEAPSGRMDEAKSLLPGGINLQGTPDLRTSFSGTSTGVPIDFSAGTNAALKLGFVAGVLLRERFPAFERLLWRACRGNIFLRRSDIDIPLEDPITGEKVNKVVFMIFFQGDQLKSRVKKICEAFRATLYPCPETAAERREMEMGVMTRIEDLSTVLSQTQEHRHRVLVAAAKNIKIWYIKVRKIKAIYHTLNMFSLDVTQKCLIAEGWCPLPDLDKIQLALRRGEENSGSTVPCIVNRMDYGNATPPTYNRVNKYTSGFQNIVDAYGAAKYREVNPAPYTIVTFPFLFAVMFGDAGHGLLMALVGLYMVVKERSLARAGRNETFGIFYGGRYIILLMGLFSIYTGLLYNDIFSKSINVFGSSWRPGGNLTAQDLRDTPHIGLDPAYPGIYAGHPYPYGVDPIWQLSKNKITFSNSYKMKISIILGVIHMLLGIALSFYNHVYFRQPMNIICEFIPQMLFLFCLFGYLCIVIMVKWIKFDAKQSKCAPSLLINLINMFLMTYPPPEKGNTCSPWLYKGQKPLQMALVIIAVLCIPWMLLPKPLLLRRKNKYYLKHGLLSPNNSAPTAGSVSRRSSNAGPDQGAAESNGSVQTDHEHVFNFPELMIEQAIHTIEFCLGCLSHTASYLRLWALSLAHAQLSEVLWNMVFRVGFGFSSNVGSIVIFCVFAIWAVLTVGILLFMEGLSAFLHALRLHWVEFQSKFYAGTGYLFEPFSFQYIQDAVAMIGVEDM